MHKNSQLPEAHKSTGSLTAVSSSVNVSSRALKNRRLHTKPSCTETLGHSDNFSGIISAHTCLGDLGGWFEQYWLSFLRLLMFSGIEGVYDTINPFHSWQLVTVRSDGTTNAAGLG